MASSTYHILILCSIFLHVFSTTSGEEDMFPAGPEKKTHIHFYFHDYVSGPDATAIQVVQPPRSTKGFGTVVMTDDLLTEGQEKTSRELGRAQGFYALASQHGAELLMTMNFVFTDGEYDGSSLALLGRNAIFMDVREMPIVGGSGAFKWARGYALARTSWLNMSTGDAIVEYNVYVIHH